MAHNNHVIDGVNKEFNLEFPNRESFLKLTEGFNSKLPDIIIKKHSGVNVVREDLTLKGGTKTRAGEFLMSTIKEDTVVYVAPRKGHAAIAIMELCALYNKQAVFFMPACKEISDYQAAVIDLKPKDVKFARIAAMPVLNKYAKDYAEKNGFKFLPFGLNHPYVIAGFVRICENLKNKGFSPKEIWTVVSTGVLTRGLQIGFPEAEMHGVCVARNMKAGELGRTKVISEPLPFLKDDKKENLPEFNTVPSYDGKGWKYVPKDKEGVCFWNVAGDIKLHKNFDKNKINSFRKWGEHDWI